MQVFMQNKMCSICEYGVVVTLFVRNCFHVLASEIHYRFYTATLHYCESISLTVGYVCSKFPYVNSGSDGLPKCV